MSTAAEATERGEFTLDDGLGSMVCGHCGLTERWPVVFTGALTFTGDWMLGVHEATNTLVILAEARTLLDQLTYLPHHCLRIPESEHQQFAPDSVLARPEPPADLDEAIDAAARRMLSISTLADFDKRADQIRQQVAVDSTEGEQRA